MVDRINDIGWQARQGSVAAIIQMLNDLLSPSGVRTRAIFADGILHILCEAAILEQLEQSILVEKIQRVLESIAPRNIRRVNINSRIVREEQLLWLQEIYEDRDNQLLWSQEIVLAQPNILKKLVKDFKQALPESGKTNLPKTKSSVSLLPAYKSKNQSTSKLVIIIISLSIGLLLGWLYKQLWDKQNKLQLLASSPYFKIITENRATNSINTNSTGVDDPFIASVRIANQASASGKSAITSTQWLALAASWQQASDLMIQVPPTHKRYQEAQIRAKLYKQYSQDAQKEAEKTKY